MNFFKKWLKFLNMLREMKSGSLCNFRINNINDFYHEQRGKLLEIIENTGK